MGRRVLIVGGVATGPKAAARARRRDPQAEITVLERSDQLSYAGCGTPYYVSGRIKEARDLIGTGGVARDAAFFKTVKNVDIRTRTLAESIDREAKTLQAIDLGTGERLEMPYDTLVLATGSTHTRLPVPGADLQMVFGLANPNDAVAIRAAASADGVRSAVVIGGGLIGLEVVGALRALGLQVTVVEALEQLLPALLDAELARLVAKQLVGQGVAIRLGERVVSLDGDDAGRVRGVRLGSDLLEADIVVVAIGVRPNVELARLAGLAIGATGAISVNEYLQTSDPDIYAGGDCVENTHLVSGRKVYVPMGSTANRHGRVIGDNVTGGQTRFPGIVGTSVFEVLGYSVGRTGLTERQARESGHEVNTALCPASDIAHYYPGAKNVIIKWVVDASTGRLLGAQGVGTGEVVKRIDVAATAITLGANVDQLANLDLGYSPPFATAIDAAQHSANVARNKRDGLARAVSAAEVKAKLDSGDDFLLLDVRGPGEYQAEHIEDPRVKLIPLGTLRQRLGDLPRDKEIVIFCRVSLRAYEAQRILDGAGFSDVKFMEGGLTAWPYATVRATEDK